MTTPAELADRFAAALFARESGNSDAVNRTIDVTQEALGKAGSAGTTQAKNDLVRELAKHLTPAAPPRVFGIIANTAGMIVEWGGDPAIALPRILDRLPALFAGVPDLAEKLERHFGTHNLDQVPMEKWRPIAEASEEARLAARAFFSIRFTCCAAMAMLVRSPELRIAARRRIDLVEAADAARGDSPYAYYLSEVLGMIDGEEITVIDLPRRLGFRVLLTGVRNNFHLFTLLQGELLTHPSAADWPGFRPHPLAVALARGDRPAHEVPPEEWKSFAGESGHGWDRAVWTFYQWPAVQPDGSLQTEADVPRGQLPWWVWGEQKPTDIATFEGRRVVILGPLCVSRSWGANFFMPLHGDLHPSATVTASLSSEEVVNLLARLAAALR